MRNLKNNNEHVINEIITVSFLMFVIFGTSNIAVANISDDWNASKPNVVASGVSAPHYDASGQIETRIHWIRIYGTQNTGVIYVDDDEVLIGGGAYTYGGQGLLTGSFPILNQKRNASFGEQIYGNRWVGQSSSHPSNAKHYLVVQAIGMRLLKTTPYALTEREYLPRNTVLNYLRYSSSKSSPATNKPSAYVIPPSGFNLISGGARVVNPFDRPGNYLTGSYAKSFASARTEPGYWFAQAKDDGVASKASIIAFAISIIKNNGIDMERGNASASIPYFGNLNFRFYQSPPDSNIKSETYFAAGKKGHLVFQQPLDNRNDVWWIVQNDLSLYAHLYHTWYELGKPIVHTVTGVGGYSQYQGGGRYLRELGFNFAGTGAFVGDAQGESSNSTLLGGQVILMIKDSGRDLWCPDCNN